MIAVPVAIAIGSNLGDRAHYLRDAAQRLSAFVADLELSPFFETDPVGVTDQPTFLNGAVVGQCRLTAVRLLQSMLEIETACGRVRAGTGAARTLDLDLILYGDETIDEPGLVVPHPRFRERKFVLEPLALVAGHWRDPLTGFTVAELLDRLPG